jgi:hypothetical protein
VKRSLPLVSIALLALLGPASALAAPSPAAARYFEIRGLAYGDLKTEASGKIAIDGTQLSASAGCNMIGGTVSVDGNVVTLVGPTFMTEMACPGTAGDAEAMLIKILQLGTFTITDGGWIADGGAIVTAELTPPSPGPAGSPPDYPVSSTPGAPVESCPPVPSGTNSTIVDGGPAIDSGGGSSGSGGSSGGGSTDPYPGSAPGSEPGGTPGIDVPPPAPNPGETTSTGPTEPESSPGVILPDPIGQDPNVGKPRGEVCAQYAAGGVVEDTTAQPKAVDAATEHSAAERSAQTPVRIAVALGLLLIVVVAGFYRRSPDATPR